MTQSETISPEAGTPDVIMDEPAQSALLSPVDDRNQQWRAEAFLLCNWGGFDGVHRVDLDPESTLISGATGAGKSTILDAYTCLMHPNKPLNSASNETGAKTRGEGIRSPLTYVRGVYDHTEQPDGSMKPLVLRGDNADTWSCIAMVFASTTGARFTLLRLFYAPREATRMGDLQARFATYTGGLREHHVVEQFEPLAVKSFRKDLMERALPGLRMLTPGDYADHAQRQLNIGSHAEGGAKALRLLYDLHAGSAVTSVDALFKQLVLERPSTFAVADAVIGSFDHLDEMHREMRDKEKQARILADIEEHHAALRDAQDEIERVDTLKLRDPDRSPFVLWAETRKDELFETAIAAAAEAELSAKTAKGRWDDRVRELTAQVKEKRRQWADLGGAEIEALDATLERLQLRLGQIENSRNAYERATRELGMQAPRTEEEFTAAQTHAREFLANYADEEQRLRQEVRTTTLRHGELKSQCEAARKEEAELGKRAGNIHPERHRIRVDFAQAAGLAVEDLPFVGELIDMAEEYDADWRVAADAVLGGFANTILVDERHRNTLRKAIDGLRSPLRIEYRGVATGLDIPAAAGESVLAGRLLVKPDSPFEGWLRNHLNREFVHECVDRAEDLGDGDQPRVTRSGQTQRRGRGAHGGHGRRTIGFSNHARRAELRAEIERLEPEIEELETYLDAVESDRERLVRRRTGCEHIGHTQWSEIDVVGARTEIDDYNGSKARLLSSKDKLQALSEHLTELEGEREQAQKLSWEQEQRAAACERQRGDLTEGADLLREHLWAMQDDESIVLTDDQRVLLDKALANSTWDGTLETFDEYVDLRGKQLGHLPRELANSQSLAQSRLETAVTGLTSAFAAFQNEWYDPNRGTGLASYEDYHAILTDLREQGLSEQRQDWARQVIEWGGEDLMTLHNAYDRTHHEIEERLRPIKRILAEIPFGDDTTLDINSSARTPGVVVAFKNTLRTLASGSMDPRMGLDEIEAKFEAIRSTVDRIRPAGDERERNLLLDVRKHLKVTASEVDGNGIRGAGYDYLRGKSGGETQTLTAFIVGAALRYHLGDEERDRPRFMPVVLDEAFIKADVRHAARGVDAWRRLGFQLVVGAPEGQFSALEQSMGIVIGVTKDNAERSYPIHLARKGADERRP
ncbi:ATP-binding protein [Microlunatus sp. GCM10028923]|uniref:ATP-binding protein n=1 Tax=Microlunatus sp. GCM10028923 TaxID=3273400 RepID=UPI003618E1CD